MGKIALITDSELNITKQPVLNKSYRHEIDINSKKAVKHLNRFTVYKDDILVLDGVNDDYVKLTRLEIEKVVTAINDIDIDKCYISEQYRYLKPISEINIPLSSVLYIEEDI